MTVNAPKDKGLTHLGLVCEALGWAQVAVAAAMALLLILLATEAPDPWGGARPQIGEIQNRLFLATLVFFVGSLLLAFAGRGFAAGSAQAARVYVVGGSIAAVAFTFIVGRGADATTLVQASVAALSWPLLIAFAIWRRPKSSDELFPYRFPAPEDGGLDGLAKLMFLAAAIELVAAGGALWLAFSAPRAPFPTVPTVVLAILLVVRAGTQLIAAWNLPSDARPAQIYTLLGMASAAVFLVANLAVGWQKEVFLFALGAAVVLFSWPYVVRRYMRTNRRLGGDEASNTRASDMGIMAVAWLLLFLGVREALSRGLGLIVATGQGVSISLETAIPAGLSFVQVWAGIELLALSKRARVACGAYAICGLAAAVLARREVLSASSGAGIGAGLGGIAAAATMALPLATFLIVLRQPLRTT